jgi:hypothetical protein
MHLSPNHGTFIQTYFVLRSDQGLLPPPTFGERRHRGLARRRVAVRRGAVLMVAEGVGQHKQMASPNKCLARDNKSRTGDKATKKRNLECFPHRAAQLFRGWVYF